MLSGWFRKRSDFTNSWCVVLCQWSTSWCLSVSHLKTIRLGRPIRGTRYKSLKFLYVLGKLETIHLHANAFSVVKAQCRLYDDSESRMCDLERRIVADPEKFDLVIIQASCQAHRTNSLEPLGGALDQTWSHNQMSRDIWGGKKTFFEGGSGTEHEFQR